MPFAADDDVDADIAALFPRLLHAGCEKGKEKMEVVVGKVEQGHTRHSDRTNEKPLTYLETLYPTCIHCKGCGRKKTHTKTKKYVGLLTFHFRPFRRL